MKKFDNLQAAIHNLKDIYSYQAPYGKCGNDRDGWLV